MTEEHRKKVEVALLKVKAMSKEEYLEYANQAAQFCKEKNLFQPGQLEELKKNPARLMQTVVLNMTLYKVVHPEES